MNNDRHLDFNKFINDRANQIQKFSEILEIDTKKKGHQSVSKSIRRRAMSHNRYRIPLRIRRPMEQQLIKAQRMQKLPKCRKNIRKKHRLLVSYRMRSGKCKWLSTHLWATKRMRMVDYFGYKVAFTPNDKSFRSAYRHFRHNACLMDFSYLRCISLNLNDEIIPDIIKINLNGKTNEIKLMKELSLSKIYEGQFIHISFVCPLLVIKQNNTKLHCYFDPSCEQEIKQKCLSFINLSQQIISPPFQIYLLLGPRSIQKIQQTMQKISSSSQIFKKQSKLSHPLYFPTNSLIYNVLGQSSNEGYAQKVPSVSNPNQLSVKQGYDPNSNDRLREQFKKYYQNFSINKNQLNEKQCNIFWDFYDKQSKKNQQFADMSESMFIKISTRSKYTHRKTNKLTKNQKKKILQNTPIKDDIIEQKIQSNKKQQQSNQREKIQEQKEVKLTNQTKNIKINPFGIAIINGQNKKDFASNNKDSERRENLFIGCYVLCSSDNNCLIWRTLTKSNVKVIGQRQYKHFLLQSGLKAFPEDYPGTKSYEDYRMTQCMKSLKRYRRQPPQKRINFQKINSPFPFFNSATTSNQYINVRVEMVGRGRCFTGSYICSLLDEDFEKIEQYLKDGQNIKHIAQEQFISNIPQKIQYNKDTCDSICQKLKSSSLNIKRKIRGFITTGGFLYNKCREGGLGYIQNRNQNQKPNSDEYVLIRKPTSRYYFLGCIIS